MLGGKVKIKSKRICHKKIVGKIGEIFGYYITNKGYGKTKYGVSVNGMDYEIYEHEVEPVL